MMLMAIVVGLVVVVILMMLMMMMMMMTTTTMLKMKCKNFNAFFPLKYDQQRVTILKKVKRRLKNLRTKNIYLRHGSVLHCCV